MSPSTTRDLSLKWAAYALGMLLIIFLHSLTLSHLTVWGVRPFLPPLLLATTASFEPLTDSTRFGLAFGIFCDLVLTSPLPCLYTLSFTLAALLSSYLAKSVFQPGFFCSLAVSAVSFLLTDLIVAVVLLAANRATASAILSRAGRELLVSLPLLLVCHPVLSFLHRRFTL